MKKCLSLFLTCVLLFSAVSFSVSVQAATFEDEMRAKGFPESYIPYLSALHAKYPNWVFEAFQTGLNFDDAVAGERSSHGKQLIQKQTSLDDTYYCNCAKCKVNGKYVIQEGSTWVSASENAVRYYMDARNWLTEKYIFQFESTAYSPSQTRSGVESIIASTWMKNANITYTDTMGNQNVAYLNAAGQPVLYSQAIMDAAVNSGMSAYYLASKIVQEVGGKTPTAGGAAGNKAPFIGMYNYYNIYATKTAAQGLQFASGFLRTASATVLYPAYDFATNVPFGDAIPVAEGQYVSYIAQAGDYYLVKLYNEVGSSFTADGIVGYVPISTLRTTYFTYGRPWTNPYLTIYHGAAYIAKSFSAYQNTGYLQKFNVNASSGSLYNHEYMANVQAAAAESATTYKAYNNAGILAAAKTFYIPVYAGMPQNPAALTDTVLPAVTGLSLQSRTKTALTFSWNAYDGATQYQLLVRNNTTGASFEQTVAATAATLSNLTPAHEYSVQVRANTPYGYSTYSAVNTKHTLPDKVSGLKVSTKASTSLTLSWNAEAGANGYYIYQYTPSTKKYKKVKTVNNGAATSVKITSLKTNTKYYYAITAFTVDSKTKESAKSAKVSATTKLETVKLKSLSTPAKGQIKTTWKKASSSITGYQIYFSKDKKFKKVIAKKDIAKKATTSYTGKGFTKGKTYYIKVRAYKTVKGKKVYAPWSSVKSIKAK